MKAQKEEGQTEGLTKEKRNTAVRLIRARARRRNYRNRNTIICRRNRRNPKSYVIVEERTQKWALFFHFKKGDMKMNTKNG